MWPRFSTTALLFLGICLFRLLNTFLIQSFFDPDEYWQTLEPAYCEVFLKPPQSESSSLNLECSGYTWEWRRRAKDSGTTRISWLEQSLHGPIRSYLSVLPTHLFYLLLKHFECDSHFWVSQGPKLLTAVLAAAPTDLAVWMVAHWWPRPSQKAQQSTTPNPAWFCLFCSMISWFHGYTLVRTFSNALETMLLSVSMALVAPELIGNEKDANGKTLRHCLCFLLGGCSVAMRFSSVTAWVPMGILLALRHRHESMWTALGFLLRVCAFFGVTGIALACAVDRCFYGFWTIPFLGSFHFNVLLGNAALYGSHPWHWYLTAGIPAIAGLWLPFVVWDFRLLFLTNNNRDSLQFARWNVWTIIWVFTLAHSIAGHKEFRFLLPILPLFCLQAGVHVRSLTIWLSQKREAGSAAQAAATLRFASIIPWLTLMAIPNLIALIYLGLFHQSAPISVNHKIAALGAAQAQSTNKMITPATYSIHYLTGACHSTPLHSYLHNGPNVRFDTWSLDCSPECRSSPEVVCESERFAKDPVGFVEKAYSSSSGGEGECANDDKTCTAVESQQDSRQPPTYLVTYSDYAWKLQSHLSSLGLQEVGRFSHGINGIRVGSVLKTGDGYVGNGDTSDKELDATYRRVSLLGDFLELSIDEMVLFA